MKKQHGFGLTWLLLIIGIASSLIIEATQHGLQDQLLNQSHVRRLNRFYLLDQAALQLRCVQFEETKLDSDPLILLKHEIKRDGYQLWSFSRVDHPKRRVIELSAQYNLEQQEWQKVNWWY